MTKTTCEHSGVEFESKGFLEKIMEMLDERIEQLRENLNGHKSQKSIGYGYDFGSLEEAIYIKEQIEDLTD